MALSISQNLKKRIIAALVLLPPVLAAVYFGGIWFHILLLVAGFVMTIEWCGMVGCGKKTLYASLVLLANTGLLFGISLLNWSLDENIMLALVGLILLTLIFIALSVWALSAQSKERMGDVWGLLSFPYVMMAVVSLGWIRAQDDYGLLIIWVLLCVWATDVGGYFVGKSVGGPKLAPKISPSKTWSGLLGGAILSAFVSLVFSMWAGWSDMTGFFFLGILIACIAQVGDLYESRVKRYFGIKDSGAIIPGHGGILDRVDGLIFVAPAVAVAFAYLNLMS